MVSTCGECCAGIVAAAVTWAVCLPDFAMVSLWQTIEQLAKDHFEWEVQDSVLGIDPCPVPFDRCRFFGPDGSMRTPSCL